MNDKTEMVSVPRELLEKALKADASQGATAMDLHHGWLAMKVLRHAINEELAAPAEDVGALGDEPVAWMQFDGEGNYDFTEDLDTAERWATNNGPKYAGWLVPLYCQPQRPVVLPECTEESFNAAGFSRYDFWNVWRAAHKSFIAEFKRLNP